MNIEERIATTHQAVVVLIAGLDEAIDFENRELQKNLLLANPPTLLEIRKPQEKLISKLWLGDVIKFVLIATAFFVERTKDGNPTPISLTRPTWENLVTDIKSFHGSPCGMLAKRKISNATTKSLVDILTDKDFLADFQPEYLGYCYEPLLEYQLETIDNKMQIVNGGDRRSTGSHYTPINNAREIVKHAIDPLIFYGCKQGKPEKKWQLISSKKILELKVCDPSVGGGIFLVQTCRYMASFLVKAWEQECKYQNLPDIDRMLLAKQAILKHCLYGVDTNRMAVEVAKLTLKLEARINSFVILDQHIKCGDALAGATVKQIAARSLSISNAQLGLEEYSVNEILNRMAIAREKIITGESTPISDELNKQWRQLIATGDDLIKSGIGNHKQNS